MPDEFYNLAQKKVGNKTEPNCGIKFKMYILNLYIPIRMNGTIEGDITGVTGMDTETAFMTAMTKDTMTAPANITDDFKTTWQQLGTKSYPPFHYLFLSINDCTVGNWLRSVCGRKRADIYSSMKFLETDSSM